MRNEGTGRIMDGWVGYGLCPPIVLFGSGTCFRRGGVTWSRAEFLSLLGEGKMYGVGGAYSISVILTMRCQG